jgi:hypothetical protein
MDPQERARIEAEIREQIVRRMRAKLGFNWHAAIFVMTNAAIAAINLRFTPNYLWFVWPLAAWGVGLALHAFAIFGGTGADPAAIDAQVRAEMARRGL